MSTKSGLLCIVCVQLEVNNISIIQSSQATQGLLKLSEWTDGWDFCTRCQLPRGIN